MIDAVAHTTVTFVMRLIARVAGRKGAEAAGGQQVAFDDLQDAFRSSLAYHRVSQADGEDLIRADRSIAINAIHNVVKTPGRFVPELGIEALASTFCHGGVGLLRFFV